MTDIREAPRKLVEFVCDTRSDWTPEETWTAVLACKTANFDWPRIVRKLIDLALQDEPVPTSPRDLWAAMRGIKSPAGAVGRLDPAVKAETLARLARVNDARNRATGPMAALRQSGEMELLREGPDP
jgi:hypothetical protein